MSWATQCIRHRENSHLCVKICWKFSLSLKCFKVEYKILDKTCLWTAISGAGSTGWVWKSVDKFHVFKTKKTLIPGQSYMSHDHSRCALGPGNRPVLVRPQWISSQSSLGSKWQTAQGPNRVKTQNKWMGNRAVPSCSIWPVGVAFWACGSVHCV